MAHRQFKDSHGRDWDVWTVVPERAERRSRTVAPEQPERRSAQDHEYRVPIGDQWARGWLAFETKGEKRRLAPIPDYWEVAPEDELERLLERASPIARTPRRLAE